jgi:ribonuclease HI
VRAWIDGAARGNPGAAGYGVVLELAADETVELAGSLDTATNNVAEYAGLLAALHEAKERGVRDLVVHSDSLLLVRQCEGAFKIKAPHLQRLARSVAALRAAIPRLRFAHVPREQNKRADALANLAIDERRPAPPWLLELTGRP